MVCATHEEVVSRPLSDAGRHTVRGNKAVDHHWTTGHPPTTGIRKSRIDFIDASNVGDTDRISVGQQQVAAIAIPDHSAQPGWCDSPCAASARGILTAECSQRLIDDGAVMAWNGISHAAGSYPYAGNQRCRRAGGTSEGLWIGRVRTGEGASDGVDGNARAEANSARGRASRAVIVNLSKDAARRIEMRTRILRHPSRIRSLERIVDSVVGGTEAGLPRAVRERLIDRQAVLPLKTIRRVLGHDT